MHDTLITNEFFCQTHFSVLFAEQRVVGTEWNLVEWNRYHRDIDCHRLYYRTDSNKTNALLTLKDEIIELKSDRIYFIPAFSVLKSEIDGEMKKYYIHFKTNSSIFKHSRHLIKKFSVDADQLTQHLFELIIQNYANNSESSNMCVQGAMNLLLSKFIDGTQLNSKIIYKFQPVLDFIDNNYKNNVSVAELASIMNINTTYFANSFKKIFGISPKQYILNKRLEESLQLLLNTELSIKEIAYSVGFENENYFSEFFASKMGISASDYRKRALNTKRDSIL